MRYVFILKSVRSYAIQKNQCIYRRAFHASELKALKGGETKYVFCHCYGYAEGKEATDCGQCKDICGKAGVQNCNFVVAK